MARKILNRVKSDNERGARTNLIEDLFYDFHRSRKQVYLMNFFRGIFFGVGSVIGATLIVGLVVAILNLFVDLPGGVGDYIESIRNSVQEVQKP